MIEFEKGYFADKNGNIYKNGKIINRIIHNHKTWRPQVIACINGKNKGLATIIATLFVENKYNFDRIIFKDDNPENCSSENIVWVSEEIFHLNIKLKHPDKYPMGKSFIKKIHNNNSFAYNNATDKDLKEYYLTKDETILNKIWQKVEKEIYLRHWNSVKGEVWEYFIDRCKRNTILGNPYAFCFVVARRKIKGLFKTIKKDTTKYMNKQLRKIEPELINC